MRRRAFDLMVSWGGILLTAVFLVSGILLMVGYNFANSNVHDQLAAQQIFFPPAGSEALKPAAIGPYLTQYAGQQLVTGPQAKAYADHFIAVHLTEGNQSEALRHYGLYRRLLQRELALDPSAQMDELVSALIPQ